MVADIMYYERNNPTHFKVLSRYIKDLYSIPVVWSSGTMFLAQFDDPVAAVIKIHPDVTIVEN